MTEKETDALWQAVQGRRPGASGRGHAEVELTQRLNQTTDVEEARAIYRELLGSIGEGFWIQPPFYCDYGSNIYIGDHFYANYGCVILDPAEVTIGESRLSRLPGIHLHRHPPHPNG